MPTAAPLSSVDPDAIKKQYPPWRIFRCDLGDLYPMSIMLEIVGSWHAPVWRYDVYKAGDCVILSGRNAFGRPLPVKAQKIIAKARQLDGRFDPRRRDPAEKAERLRAFASRFSALLQDDFTEGD